MQHLSDLRSCLTNYLTAKKCNNNKISIYAQIYTSLPNQSRHLSDFRSWLTIYLTAKLNATLTWYVFMPVKLPYCQTKCNNYLILISWWLLSYLTAKPSVTITWYELMLELYYFTLYASNNFWRNRQEGTGNLLPKVLHSALQTGF